MNKTAVEDREKLLSVQQVAAMLAVSPRTVWRLAASGVLSKPMKVGGASRFLLSELQAFIARGGDEQGPGRFEMTSYVFKPKRKRDGKRVRAARLPGAVQPASRRAGA